MMNIRMLKTELYKICSKRIIWISLVVFIVLFLIIKLQFWKMTGVRYTLEPMRAELTKAVDYEEFHDFVRSVDYSASLDEIERYIPETVIDYIEQYKEDDLIYRSLNSDLVRIINNYFERIDNRTAYFLELAEDVAVSDDSSLTNVKTKLLNTYKNTPVNIDLNLGRGANSFIDINHSAVFPGLIMLVIIVGLAGIYSDEYTSGTQSALLTSHKGRRGVFLSKLCASWIFITIVVAIMECSYFVITEVCYHIPDIIISAASTYGLSLTTYSGSVFEFCVRQVLGTLFAGYVLGSIVMCISAFSKNALIPFFVAGLYYGGTAFYANSITFPVYLSALWSLPGELSLFMLQTQYELVAIGHYTTLLGMILPTLTVNVIFNIIIAFICLLLCYNAYTRKQVKD